MADAVKMRMVIPFHVEKPRNSAIRTKKLIPTKFGKCLILMWLFGETSEAAMRALNIVVMRTGPPLAQAWSRSHIRMAFTNPAAVFAEGAFHRAPTAVAQRPAHRFQPDAAGSERPIDPFPGACPIPCLLSMPRAKNVPATSRAIELLKRTSNGSLAQMAFWRFDCGAPRSHYHLGCAEEERPCGSWANDAEQLKLCYVKLPETLQKVIAQKSGPG
jgi:hypothetical protein